MLVRRRRGEGMRPAGGTLVLVVAIAAAAQAGVSGRVVGTDGKPLAGATVNAHARETAEQQGDRHAAGRERAPLASARSGADGSFRIDAGRPFAWLEARAPGFSPALVTVTEEPVTLTLRRAALKRGIIRANGRPLAGAVVVWTSDGAETIARTGPDGSYEAPDPEAAPGMVQVIHPDFAPLQTGVWNRGGKPALDLALNAGVGIAGSVVDAAGRPVAGATVWVDGDLPGGKTDAQGAFRIPHAQPDWSFLTARTERLVGTALRRAGAIVVTAKPGRSVSGVVRDDKTGQPVAGATVVASTSGGVTASADSDARGQYDLVGLPSGRYRLYAGRDGFTSGPADYATAEPLDLRDAVSARRDFALARHPRVTGRVEDEERRPVDGALVMLGFKDTPAFYALEPFEGMAGGATRTATDGSFSLPAPPSELEGAPFMKDRPLVVLKAGFAAGQADAKSATPGGAPVVIRLTRGVELKGRVVAGDGSPIAGVAVSAAQDGAFGGTMMPMHLLLANTKGEGWATTDAAGRFSLRVHPAVHHLSFRKPGLAPRIVRGHDPRSTAALEVALDPAAVVRGRVARADGRGIADVTVAAAQEMTSFVGSGVSGPEGSFEIGDLAPGVYQITASHEELGIQETRTVEAPAADVQIVLAPSGTLRGRVIEAASGQPVTRFKVHLEPGDGSAKGVREVPSEDAGGAFSIADVPIGEIAMTTSAEGYASKRVDATVTADADAPDLEVAMDAEAVLTGRVTSEGKAAVPEARISVEAPDAAETLGATSDDDGAYELRGVAPGEVKLSFAAQGFLPEKRTLDSRESTRLDVTLRRGLALRGEVVSANGAGVAQAFVMAHSSAQGATSQSTQTDERGRFNLEGLVPGRYKVTASASGKGEAKAEDVDVERAGPLRLVLERPRTAVLTGKVIGLPAGEEAGFVVVMASGEEGASANTMVDSSHAFRMEDAPAGRVQVRAAATYMSGTMRSTRPVELTLAAGTETETVLRFSGDAVITGTVTRDGAPVPGVMVAFSSGDEMGSAGRTDAHGAYEVAGLEPGPHQVNVAGDNVSYATPYVVTGSAEFDIDITGGTVSGRVVRADDGAPIGSVGVSLFRTGENENTPATSVTTNGQGIFSARSLREGRYRLITSKAGFGQEVRDVEVPRGEAAEVLLELRPADGISVTVVDARDGRVLEAIVVVRDTARRIVANEHSGVGEDGVLNIPLANGSYLLSTSASGYGTVTLPVTAPSQGLRIGLTPGGTLVIESARDLRGKVRLIQPDGEEYVRCWCNGIAEIQLKGQRTVVENITPGSYTVELVEASGGVTSKPALIREGQTSTVTFE